MTHRKRLSKTLRFESVDRGIDYEFGVWEQTITRWHREGLPEEFTGMGGFCGEGSAIDEYFKTDNMEYGPSIGVNVGLVPGFAFKVIEKKSDYLIAIDGTGATVEMLRPELGASIPHSLRYAIETKEDWKKLCDQRLNPSTSGRIPVNLDELCEKSCNADYPISIFCGSLYGFLRNWMGLENISVALHDNETWVEDMMEHLTDLTLTILKENLANRCKIDLGMWWEDMCYNKGPLISPDHFKKLMVPRYKRITDFLRDECGCQFNMVDSDGNIDKLVPLWLEGGINLMTPLEKVTDAYKVSNQFGKRVPMRGYFSKWALIKGKEAIDKEFKRLEPLFKRGGFIPHIDHAVPPDVSWENYCYYRKRKCEFIGKEV